jgi:outer membrane receptor protein involved in Fe transport
MRLSLTVTNLLDADPPVIAAYGDRGGAQLVSPNYDIFGRRYSLGLNYSF